MFFSILYRDGGQFGHLDTPLVDEDRPYSRLEGKFAPYKKPSRLSREGLFLPSVVGSFFCEGSQ